MHSEFYFEVFDSTRDRVPLRSMSNWDAQLPFPPFRSARYCSEHRSDRKEKKLWMQPWLYWAPVRAHPEDVRMVDCNPAVLASYRIYRADCRSNNQASWQQKGKDSMNSSIDLPAPSYALSTI